MKQYAAIDDTVYFWFAGNDTSGSGGDGASPAADIRLAGAAAGAAPVYSPTPTLLSHASYPAGAYEIAIAATAANGFAASNTYAVFCTLAIDSQNPTGFVGSFDTKPVESNVTQLLDTAWLTPSVAGTPDVNAKQLGGTAQTGRDVGASVLLSSGTGAGQLDFTSGIVKSNLTQILAHLLTQTGTQLADAFEHFFDVATPTGTVDSLPAAAPNAAGGLPISAAGGLDLDTKLANTNEITVARMGALTDWINGGRLDLILDIIAADTTTDIPALIATAQADLDTITGADGVTLATAQALYAPNKVVPDVAGTLATYDPPTNTEMVAAFTEIKGATWAALTDTLEHIRNKQTDIETDTNELQGDWTNGGRLDLILDIVAADTTTDIPALIATAQADLDLITGADGATLATAQANYAPNVVIPDAAGVAATPAEVATALTDIHLDHLLAVNYDPASKPGVATALLNELVENDGGVSRYTANALEQAPSGGTNPNVLIDTTIATVTDQTHIILTAGSNDDDAYKDQAIVVYDASDSDYPSVRVVSTYAGATKTITLDSAPDFTMVAGDGSKVFVTAPGTTAPTVGQIRTEMEGAGYKLALIEADTNELQGDWVNGGRLDLLLDAIPTTAMRGTDSAALAATALSDVMWTDAKAGALTDWINGGRLDLILDIIAADTTTDIPALIATAQADLDLITGADGVTLATLQALYAPNVVIPDAAGVAPTAGENADAVWDELLTGATHNIANSAGRRLREVGAFAIHAGTAQAGTSTSITLAATANGGDGIYNRNLIVLVDNTGAGQTRTIVDYNDTSKVVVIDRDWRVTPDATTTYQIVPDDTPLTVDHGKAQAGTPTTITLRTYASAIDETYKCNQVGIIAGTGRGQVRLIGSYNGTTKVATICGDNWVTTPDTTSIYVMMPYGTTCASCVGDYALTQINAECDTALTDYDPPTRTEATTDKDAIITEVDANETKIDTLQTDSTAIKAKTDNLPSGIAKNVALPKFTFLMVLSSDHVTGATGKTVTGVISKDGGAFASITNAITEVSGGMYKIASGFTQAEMNADVIDLVFSETNCDDRVITIHTS